MIPSRQRPRGKRIIRSAFSDQVPAVIEAYVGALLMQAEREASEMVVDQILRTIKDTIKIEHLPSREAFEEAFLCKRANPAEIKIDEESDRVYLVGVGLPGREELVLEKVPVYDKYNQIEGHELMTLNKIEYDTVLSFVEVSWREYGIASERAKYMDETTVIGLSMFFDLPVTYGVRNIPALILALPGLTGEDLDRIAMNALTNKAQGSGNQGQGPISFGNGF